MNSNEIFKNMNKRYSLKLRNFLSKTLSIIYNDQKIINKTIVLQDIINHLNAIVYLEIGVFEGSNFIKINAPKKIAVDPLIIFSKNFQQRFASKNMYFEMSSDEFFNKKQNILIKEGLDVVFIDGLHTYEQSLKDILNSLTYLNENGVIVMHDCNPPHEAAAYPASSLEHALSLNLPGWNGLWYGDIWKTILHLRTTRKDLEIFVLNCDCGLGIISKGEQKNRLKDSLESIINYTYKDLKENREKLLNLKHPKYYLDFFNISRKKYRMLKKLRIKYSPTTPYEKVLILISLKIPENMRKMLNRFIKYIISNKSL